MNVVVTGAAGFVGSHVVRRLTASPGVTVVPVSRRAVEGVHRVRAYTESPEGDVLVHLAEESSRARAASAGAVCEEEARVTLDALLAKGYGRIVYASSAVLYGDASNGLRTIDDPVHVTDAYTRMKRRAELSVLASRHGVVARLANLYGPGMAAENVMNTILRQIPGSGPLRVLDTAPVRDFLWIEDAAAGMTALALARGSEGIFNVGTGIGTSIADVARAALAIAGEGTREVESTGGMSRPSSLTLDCSRTFDSCGWRAQTSLRRGLERLLGRPEPPAR